MIMDHQMRHIRVRVSQIKRRLEERKRREKKKKIGSEVKNRMGKLFSLFETGSGSMYIIIIIIIV
jgi:hypothetical protein